MFRATSASFTRCSRAQAVDFCASDDRRRRRDHAADAEHLAILDLLGVDRGAVVITKADLGFPEAIENVARRGKAMIAATTLAQAEVLTVSALTGAGVDALRAHLEEASGASARSRR
jgi:selenocysteine-specific translation elongation factor